MSYAHSFLQMRTSNSPAFVWPFFFPYCTVICVVWMCWKRRNENKDLVYGVWVLAICETCLFVFIVVKALSETVLPKLSTVCVINCTMEDNVCPLFFSCFLGWTWCSPDTQAFRSLWWALRRIKGRLSLWQMHCFSIICLVACSLCSSSVIYRWFARPTL